MSSEEEDYNGRKPFTEGELIRFKREKRKQRKEKLIESLEKKRKNASFQEEYDIKRKEALEKEKQVRQSFDRSHYITHFYELLKYSCKKKMVVITL